MKNGSFLSRSILIAAVAVWLAGCASSPQPRYYLLSPAVTQATKVSSPGTNPLSISIAPVEIPDYLNRPQIVTRYGQSELKLAEYDRWGGSLADNIAAVTAENLSLLLATDRVQAMPRGLSEKFDYVLLMRVLRLDCIPGQEVNMMVQWTLSSGAGGKDIATHVSTSNEKLKDARFDTMVAAVSAALGQVSRQIVAEIPPLQKSMAVHPAAGVSP